MKYEFGLDAVDEKNEIVALFFWLGFTQIVGMTSGLGQLAFRTFVLRVLNSHRLSFLGGVVFAPVLEWILVHLKVDFHHARLNSLLHFCNRRVAYRLGWLQQLAHA